MFNVYATIALRQAIEQLREGMMHEATAHLARTTVYVQGFAPAGRTPQPCPPTSTTPPSAPSCPTVVPVPLSGSMHVEYRQYRDAVDELLEVLPESIEDLARHEPGLAFAREALLEADLIEAERRVTLVEPVVGSERSLVQPPATMDNAVSVLRPMRHVRAAKAACLVRFGDHLVAAVARPSRRPDSAHPRRATARTDRSGPLLNPEVTRLHP
ncbi:hypothetical protein ACPB9E_07950 [Streptomyces exfoliatus]|uniref:hypothetical protein n=1 Tax=Streptomyces exfoliatus TaxID=1905 RepID=UPI003C2BBE3C